MTATNIDITIEQGATFAFSFEWRYESIAIPGTPGDPVDLTGAEARMQIRKKQSDPVLIEALSSGTNVYIVLGGATGTVSVKIPPDETNLLTSKTCLYDMEIVMPNGDIYRAIEGVVTVKPNITQMPTDPPVGT